MENDERRAFWTDRMDEGEAFMRAILQHPVEECGEGLVSLPDVARGAAAEVVFSDTLLGTGLPRRFLLRKGLAPAFCNLALDLNRRGFVLKVEDGFRDRAMQKCLALTPALLEKVGRKLLWELDGGRPSAAFLARRLCALIAHCPKTGTHMSGSAMDLSVLKRSDRSEVDRGARYLEMSELTPMDSPFVPEACRRNRAFITGVLAEHGFAAYPFEFWHYSAGDAIAELAGGTRRPARYGAVDLLPDGRVTPIADPFETFNSPEALAAALEKAMGEGQRVGRE